MSSIPIGWKYLSLGEVAKVTSGGTPDRQNKNYWGGKIPWISTGEINFNSIYASRECITEEGLKHSSAKLLSPGTVLMAMYGQGLTRGRVAVLQVMGTVNQNCAAIVVEEDVSAEYIYQYLSHHYDDIRSLSHYGGIDHLNNTLVRAIKLPLPPLAEQRKIVAILGTWDAAIDRAERLVAALKARKKALMQRLLTGEMRFPGFAGEWEIKRFDQVFARVMRKNTVGNTNVLTASGIHGLVSQVQYFNRSVAGADLTGYYLLKHSEFAYNRSSSDGYPYGAIKQLQKYDAGILSTLYLCFRLADQSCDANFYRHFFEAGGLERGIYSIAQEGARNHGLLNVGVADFFSLDIPVPSPKEQRRLADFFNTVDSEIDLAIQQLNYRKQQKRGLMQRLLTGEVRVAVDG